MDIKNYSQHLIASFSEGECPVEEAITQFNDLIFSAANNIYEQYSKADTNEIIRRQFNKILGIDFKTATRTQRRQAWRAHGTEVFSVIENVLIEKMVSGWDESNARFMELVEDRNIARGDINQWYVDSTSLLQVSVWSGNHHDIVRQKVLPGKAFTIDTNTYVIKCYTDYELFMLGRVDWSGLIALMYKSIEKYRYSALYTAFMSLENYIPSDLKADLPFTANGKQSLVEQIEAVRAATGKDVMLVGTRTAMQKLQSTINYSIWSEEMKNTQWKSGMLGMWEGYECLALERVNKEGTRDSIFTANDNKKIFIIPKDTDFKPIKRINEGDVEVASRGEDGLFYQDRTMDTEIWYREGIGIIVDELFGLMVDNS